MTRWNQGKSGRSRERPNENRCLFIIARRYPPELLIHLDGNCMIVHLCWCNFRLPAWNFLFGYEKKELKSASVSYMQSCTGTLIFLHQKTRHESSLKMSDFWSEGVLNVLLSVRNVMVAYRCRRVRAQWHLKDTTSFVYKRLRWRKAIGNPYFLSYSYHNAEIKYMVLSDYLTQLE